MAQEVKKFSTVCISTLHFPKTTMVIGIDDSIVQETKILYCCELSLEI